jgi:hypothetical protein
MPPNYWIRPFAFLGRQKRITVDHEDYYIDLLFYHRGLNCLVVVELKLDKFKPEYEGQMRLYLKYVEKYEMRPGENLPIGLILCAQNAKEIVELMMLENDRIKIAEYLTKLPPKKVLEERLHRAIEESRREICHYAGSTNPITAKIEAQGDTKAKPKTVGKITKKPVTRSKSVGRNDAILKITQSGWHSRHEIAQKLGLRSKETLLRQIKDLLQSGALESLYPQTPNHRKQQYRAKNDEQGKA